MDDELTPDAEVERPAAPSPVTPPSEPPGDDTGFDFLTASFDPLPGEGESDVAGVADATDVDLPLLAAVPELEPVADVADEPEPARPFALVPPLPPASEPVSEDAAPAIAAVPDAVTEPEAVSAPVSAFEPDPEPELPFVPEPAAGVEPMLDSWPAADPEPTVDLEPALEAWAVADPEEVPVLEPALFEPEPEPAKVPWYKREIGGRKEAAAPSPERERRRPQRRLRPDHAAPAADAPAAEARVPFYKRELSLGRKAEPADTVVASAPAPALDTAPERVPFYKRELSLGRKAGRAESAAPAPAPAADTATERVPFYKRELGRKKPVAAEAMAPPPTPASAVEAAERVPFYKRELSLGRKKAADQPAEQSAMQSAGAEPRVSRAWRKPVPAATAVVAAAPDEAPTEERTPLYKRELSFGRRERRPAAAPKTAKEPGAAKEKKEKSPKAPRAKRELSLPKLERGPKARKAAGEAAKRHKKLVGLKIGASQLAAAQLVNNGHAELVKVARDPLLDGIVSGGELRDPDALTEALRVFFKKHNLPRRGVRLGIANNRIGVRTFELVGIDDPKQLANAIKFRAQEALPIPIEEAVIDWRVLSEQVNEEGQRTRRILLVVAYRELVDRYVAACRRAGIQLVGIDLEAFALLRALGDGGRRSEDDGALVAVSVGHERSTFAVSDGDVCEFTRVLEWGGNSLNVAIARALDKAPSEVEELKHTISLDRDASNHELPDGFGDEAVVKALEAVRRQLQTFARELVSSLQFYQNQPGSLGIGEIILTGGTAQMPGLAAELERLIGVRVRVGDPLRRVRASKRLPDDGLGSLSVAIGLGIED